MPTRPRRSARVPRAARLSARVRARCYARHVRRRPRRPRRPPRRSPALLIHTSPEIIMEYINVVQRRVRVHT